MKRLVFLTALLVSFLFVNAQDVVLEKNVEEQYGGTKGPNMRHFKHFYIGAGNILDFDENEGSSINPWKSSQFIIGRRYKLKLLSFYSLGLDFNYKISQYMLEGDDQDPASSIINPLAIDGDEKNHSLLNNSFGLEVYQRINIDKRGNKLGKYFDIGFRGEWNVTDVQTYTMIDKTDSYAEKRKFINRRLKYVEAFSYGPTARIGFNKWAIYGNYRLSDHFKSSFQMAELPRWSVGIQLALF